MTKLAGFVLLQLSALLYSFRASGREKEKLLEAAAFLEMLEQLYGLLECEASPMPELLQKLIGRTEGAAALFTEKLLHTLDMLGPCSFRELWKEALNSSLAEKDRELLRILEKPGAVLGRYELKTQLELLHVILCELRQYCEKQRQKLPQARRLKVGLSLSAGLLLGILLL